MQRFKTNTHWISSGYITRKSEKSTTDLVAAFKTHPFESIVWSLVFVGALTILSLVVTNRLDVVVELSGRLYQAIPKVFK